MPTLKIKNLTVKVASDKQGIDFVNILAETITDLGIDQEDYQFTWEIDD